jgi:hypothetical protein
LLQLIESIIGILAKCPTISGLEADTEEKRKEKQKRIEKENENESYGFQGPSTRASRTLARIQRILNTPF